MAKQQKKTAKGRLDKWYRLAKEQGFRSRAAFKLIQLNKKFDFLSRAKVVIDLCAAPGGWLQVAAKSCKRDAIIVGVDLAPIKPVPGAETFVCDITTDQCRSQLRGYLKTWKADVVLHDGAPNVGTAWLQDAFAQAELVLQSLKLASEFLVPGGHFVTKVFRSNDFNKLIWVFNQLFNRVHVTKPQSSRDVSAEIFVVCLGYKAPVKLDPKFLDAKYVFEDVQEKKTDAQSIIYHPEKRRKHRDGYEDGDYTLFKTVSASDFINGREPLQILSTANKIMFESEDDLKFKNSKHTSAEVLINCDDLKVLGRREFKILLKWRLKCRKDAGLEKPKEGLENDGIAVDDSKVVIREDDATIDGQLEQAGLQEQFKSKKSKKKEMDRKMKALKRMSTAMNSQIDATDDLDQNVFKRKTMFPWDKNIGDQMPDRDVVTPDERPDELSNDDNSSDSGFSEAELLDAQLNEMHEMFKQSKELKYQQMLERNKNKEKDEFTGISSDSDTDDDSEPAINGIHEPGTNSGTYADADVEAVDDAFLSRLSRKAATFFDNKIFSNAKIGIAKDTNGGKSSTEKESINGIDKEVKHKSGSQSSHGINDQPSREINSHSSNKEKDTRTSYSSEDDSASESDASGTDLAALNDTAVAMALQMKAGGQRISDIRDESYNRWSFQPVDNLPDWFLEDEDPHRKPQKPLTKEASELIKSRQKALLSQPIKKVLEAQGRRKQRAARKAERLQKKAEQISASAELSEKEKAAQIQRMMSRAMKSKPKRKTTLVVAKGANRALRSRPKGVKGHYKMVDSRMKKDVRAMKRVQKRR